MQKVKKLVVAIAVSGALLLSFSCTKHPNEDQIRVMEETRQAALDAEKKIQDLESQKKQLQSQLAGEQKKVDDVKKDKADTEARVANWGK